MIKIVSCAALLLAGFEPGRVSTELAAPVSGAVDCAQVTAEARPNGYGGYYHVVVLANGCKKPVRCEVWTDVDPTPHQTLTANAGETSEITIRLSSPSRIVTAGRACSFQ